jgi:hypothetical protein
MSDAHHDAHPHGEHDVHVYEGPGIEEGNAKVPTWYKVFLLGMAIFAVVYIVQNLTGWSPMSAKWK